MSIYRLHIWVSTQNWNRQRKLETNKVKKKYDSNSKLKTLRKVLNSEQYISSDRHSWWESARVCARECECALCVNERGKEKVWIDIRPCAILTAPLRHTLNSHIDLISIIATLTRQTGTALYAEQRIICECISITSDKVRRNASVPWAFVSCPLRKPNRHHSVHRCHDDEFESFGARRSQSTDLLAWCHATQSAPLIFESWQS